MRVSRLVSPHPAVHVQCVFTHIFADAFGVFEDVAGQWVWRDRARAGALDGRAASRTSFADAFGVFEDVGLDGEEKLAEGGGRFRETVLALGGSVHPLEVFPQFRGRGPSTDALLRHAGLTAR